MAYKKAATKKVVPKKATTKKATTKKVVSGAQTPDAAPKRRRPVNYLNNADLLKQVKLSKAQGRMTEELGNMLMTLVKRYASKGNFINYTYNDEMQLFALMMLTRTWASFDETRFTNCFAYYTQCTKNSFIQYLNSEKKNQRMRDELLIEAGLNPSYSYQLDYETNSYEDGEVSYISPQEHADDAPVVHDDVEYFAPDEFEPNLFDKYGGSETPSGDGTDGEIG